MLALEHAIEPPAAQLLAVVVAPGGHAACVGQGLFQLSRFGPALEQQVESAIGSEALGLDQFRPAGAESSPAVQMRSPFAAPAVSIRWAPGLPGIGRVDVFERGHEAPISACVSRPPAFGCKRETQAAVDYFLIVIS